MKTRTVLVVFLALGAGVPASASAQSASGPAALALAGVIAPNSPVLSSADRRNMARLFAGHPVTMPAGRTVSVTADAIDCEASSTDIASRTCALSFADRRLGERKVMRTGRAANELFATLAAAGGSAGTPPGASSAKVARLVCTIDPNKMRQRSGDGADCVFEKGQ